MKPFAITRRRLLPLGLALGVLPLGRARAQPQLSPPALSAPDRADVARVEAYLQGMHSLKAHFLQVGPDGAVTQGIAWISRPGRMRFQYDPPTPLLLVANHGEGIFQDRQLGQVSHFPLSSTPLGILLANQIHLSGAVTVSRVSRLPGQLQLTLFRTASPGDGTLTLVFADQPLALKQWSVIDAQQNETRVSLFNVELGGSFPDKLFEFVAPPPGFGTGNGNG